MPHRVNFEKCNVIVIGDVMFDVFNYGVVDRISPESPVPVLSIKEHKWMLGGAGNVLANFASLNVTATLIGYVGNDADGQKINSHVNEIENVTNALVVCDSIRTIVKSRYVSQGHQLLRCDIEDKTPVSVVEEDQLIENFKNALPDANVVAVSDYAKGVLTDRVLDVIFSECKKLNIPVVVDPKRQDFTCYKGATVIKPNRLELKIAANLPCSNDEEIVAATHVVMKQTNADILLTLSEDGIWFSRQNKPPTIAQSTAVEVFDVSGAGDTVLAVFCSAITNKYSYEQAASLANVAAGIVVTKIGTAVVHLEELANKIWQRSFNTELGLVSWDSAKESCTYWKQNNLTVGFTNGCFDILHSGHIELLEQAKACCDRLIVGINSDVSVSRLKGDTRPVNNIKSRARVLAGIGFVDIVVVFDEDTPLKLIQTLLPTALIKGADYTESQVVGAKEVKAIGGKIHLVELVPDMSTTNAIERIHSSTKLVSS